jgi:hypothetical protein
VLPHGEPENDTCCLLSLYNSEVTQDRAMSNNALLQAADITYDELAQNIHSMKFMKIRRYTELRDVYQRDNNTARVIRDIEIFIKGRSFRRGSILHLTSILKSDHFPTGLISSHKTSFIRSVLVINHSLNHVLSFYLFRLLPQR